MTAYTGMEEFYRVRGGTYSPESDYGSFNWDDTESPGAGPEPLTAVFRVSHVEETGDFYAIHNHTGRVVLLGSVPAAVPEKTVYAHFKDWAQRGGPGRPFSWFKERIESLPG